MIDTKIEQQRRHFDSISESYRLARRNRNHLLLKDLIWGMFLRDKYFLDGGTLRVLEPMCGFADGRNILSRYLNTEVLYRGFDYSDQVVRRLIEDEPGIDVWTADVTRYRPPRGAFDVIILLGGLHHVPDHAAEVVAQLSDGLRSGGYFFSLEPTHGNSFFKAVREGIYKKNRLFDEETERGFMLRDYMALFEAADLRLVDRIFPGLLSYVLYYNPDAFPWLNVGGVKSVKFAFALDRPFLRTRLAGVFSFATLALWQKAP